MTRPVAITGLGAISPMGHSVEAICAPNPKKETETGKMVPLSALTRLQLIENFDSAPYLGERLKRKLDLFSVYGLCAAQMALKDSRLTEGAIPKERIGVFVGNCLGGWGFTEPELRQLHSRGVGAMGPYVATAWFPAAVQGQISLAHGLTGHSKTFSASDVAGLQALGYAVRAIQSGRADAIVCGAVESLGSPYMQAILGNCDPGEGDAFAEGAAFMVVEDYQLALARNARIYGLVSGFDDRFSAQRAQTSDQAVRSYAAIEGGNLASSLLLHCGGVAGATAKFRFGQMFSVSGPMEVVCSAYHLHHGTLTGQGGDEATASQVTRAIVHRRGQRGGVVSFGVTSHHH